MKFNLSYVKQKPVLFGVIFVVFGVFVWVLLNKNSGGETSAGGSTSYVSTGPSDAEVAANVALGQASIAAQSNNYQAGLAATMQERETQASLAAITQQNQTDLAIATLSAQIQLQGQEQNNALQSKGIDAQMASIAMQTNAALAMQQDANAANLAAQRDQNATQLAFFQNSNETMLKNVAINAQTQIALGEQQLEGYKFATAVNQVGSLKKKDRDNVLTTIVNGRDYRAGGAALPMNVSTGNMSAVAPPSAM